MRQTRLRRRGFTLLELLVGMAIFVLLAGTAYAGLRAAGRTWDKTERQAESARESALAFDYLRRELSSAFPLAILNDNRWGVWFDGGPGRLVFLVEGSRQIGLSGLYQIVIQHNTGASPPRLDLYLQALDDELEIGELRADALHRVLLDEVSVTELRYFGQTDPRQDAQWYDEWRHGQLLPRLVSLRFEGAGVQGWPMMTVRIPVEGLRFRRSRRPEVDESEAEGALSGDLEAADIGGEFDIEGAEP